MLDDKKLWDDFRANEDYALSQIYINNIEMLYNCGGKLTNDEDLIKDTIQELFFDLIRNRENLGSTDNICFYLLKSFKRKLIRGLNLKKSVSFLEEIYDNHVMLKEDADDDLMIKEVTSDDVFLNIEENIIKNENISQQKDMILYALDKISPKQQEILFYRYTCNFGYEKICEIMMIDYTYARILVSRAIKSLKKHLGRAV